MNYILRNALENWSDEVSIKFQLKWRREFTAFTTRLICSCKAKPTQKFNNMIDWLTTHITEILFSLRIAGTNSPSVKRALIRTGKRDMRVDKRIFAQEFWWNKSCMTNVGFVWVFSTFMSWSNGNKIAWALIKVDKWELAWDFSQLLCREQAKTRIARELKKIEALVWLLNLICSLWEKFTK